MTKIYSRDSKGRFCTSSNPELKTLNFLMNKESKNIDVARLIDILTNSMYKANVRFADYLKDACKSNPNRKCTVDFKVNEPSIVCIIGWEQA